MPLDSASIFNSYLQQITLVREAMRGSAVVANSLKRKTATEQYYQDLRKRVLLFQAALVLQELNHERKVKNYYGPSGPIAVITKEEILSQTKAKTAANNTTELYYDQLDDYSKAILAGSTLIPPANPETGASMFDEMTTTNLGPKIEPPSDVILDTAAKEASGENVIKFFEHENINSYPGILPVFASQFPTPGEEVETHNRIRGEIIANKTSFNIGDPLSGQKKIYKSWTPLYEKTFKKSTHGTPDDPYTDKINAMIEDHRKQTPGSYRFFIEKLHGKSIDGTFYKKGPIKAGMTRDELPNRMVFPAYIEDYNDSYSSSWGEHKFIGRGEKVYMYEETTRTLAVSFWMMSDFSVDLLVAAVNAFDKLTNTSGTVNGGKLDNTSGGLAKTAQNQISTLLDGSRAQGEGEEEVDANDIMKEIARVWPDWGDGTTPNSSFTKGDKTGFVYGKYSGTPEQMWARQTFLAQCCYAWFRKDGKMKEQPFVRIRIGDFFDVVAKIDGIDFTQEEFSGVMDLNPSVIGAIPMAMKVAMRMTIIHEDEPTSDYPRFYHRRDFDNPDTYNEKPDALKENSKYMDSTMDRNQAKSPISNVSSLSNFGREHLAFPKDVKAVQESLSGFGSALSILTGTAGGLKDLSKIEKIKEALKNAKRLLDVSKQIDVLTIKDTLDKKPVVDVKSPVDIAKQGSVTNRKQPLFPQFKTPDVTPPTV